MAKPKGISLSEQALSHLWSVTTAQGAQWSGLMIAAMFMRGREGAASQSREHTAGMVHQTR